MISLVINNRKRMVIWLKGRNWYCCGNIRKYWVKIKIKDCVVVIKILVK